MKRGKPRLRIWLRVGLTIALTAAVLGMAVPSNPAIAPASVPADNPSSAPTSPLSRQLRDLRLVNYLPSDAGWQYMWIRWEPDRIDAGFAEMAGLGAYRRSTPCRCSRR
jgi:hypothetical protein